MGFDFKNQTEVRKIQKNKSENKKLILPFIIFCIPFFGFFAILIGDFRYARSHCNGFEIPAKFLMYSVLSLVFSIFYLVPFILLPALVLPYLYAKFHASFYNEAIRKFG